VLLLSIVLTSVHNALNSPIYDYDNDEHFLYRKSKQQLNDFQPLPALHMA